MESNKANSFLTRALSGAVFAIIVIGAILLSKYTFIALLAAVCVLGMSEFYQLAGRVGAQPLKVYGTILGVLIIGGSSLILFDVGNGAVEKLAWAIFPTLIVAFFAIFIIELYRKKDNPLVNIAATITGIVYVAVPLAMLTVIAYMDANVGIQYSGQVTYSPWAILCYFILVWANDVGAYVFGVALGKHKLFERISPKKSWEGFFGGLIVAVTCGVIAGWLLGQSLWFWGGLATVIVATGVWGDLVESMFKRSAGVKDSGAIMPGHGGALDRFDALLLSAPFVMVYFIIFA